MRTQLISIGIAAGLDRVGFAATDPFPAVEGELERRNREGLSGRLGFTYNDPGAATNLRSHFPWAQTLVVAAKSYRPSTGQRADSGMVAASARLPGYEPLRRGLEDIQKALLGAGHDAEVLCDDNRLVDRAAAVRAGIGWWGKNSMVLAPGLGPWFLIGSVVTDLAIEPDRPMTRGCGSCAACLPACPTGALVAPGILDARRCLAAWAQTPGVFPIELREPMGARLYGCDDCLDACPPGRAFQAAGSDDGLRFDLRWVLWAADWTLLAEFGHWFIPHRDPRIIRRNALIAAGNSRKPEMVEVVAPYAAHPDWLLRAHAVWALQKLDGARAVIDERLRLETDPRVRQELDRVPIGK
ncbi:MAG: tRNA epoxyqueuosine(34) reductase QueG [Acidimicrobiia bacterium]|nr:tRNA epoxyqueuosine(34) reductase QueG [Acidimicrobiia bacterium]